MTEHGQFHISEAGDRQGQRKIKSNRKHYEKGQLPAKRYVKSWAKLNRWQQAAVIDFVYNKGEGALASSTMLRLLNEGRTYEACDELLKWVKAKNRKTQKLEVLGGLVLRADTTNELCRDWK